MRQLWAAAAHCAGHCEHMSFVASTPQLLHTYLVEDVARIVFIELAVQHNIACARTGQQLQLVGDNARKGPPDPEGGVAWKSAPAAAHMLHAATQMLVPSGTSMRLAMTYCTPDTSQQQPAICTSQAPTARGCLAFAQSSTAPQVSGQFCTSMDCQYVQCSPSMMRWIRPEQRNQQAILRSAVLRNFALPVA